MPANKSIEFAVAACIYNAVVHFNREIAWRVGDQSERIKKEREKGRERE